MGEDHEQVGSLVVGFDLCDCWQEADVLGKSQLFDQRLQLRSLRAVSHHQVDQLREAFDQLREGADGTGRRPCALPARPR